MLLRVLVQNGVEISDEVVLEYDLVGKQMRKQRKGGSVELGQLVAETLVGILIFVSSTLQVDLVLAQGYVFPVGSRLLLLKGLGAALVTFVINLEVRQLATYNTGTAQSVPFYPRAS